MRSVWLLLLLAGWCSAEQDSYTLAGVVVNAKTGEPVKRALVTANWLVTRVRAGSESRVEPASFSTFSDTEGAFRFAGLSSGEYLVRAQKPQFTQSRGSGPVRWDSANKQDIRIELSPLGVIEGTIADQRGQPASSVKVLVMRTSIADGWRENTVEREVWTDDRGMFRAWDIQSGRFLVRAAGRAGNTYSYLGDSARTDGGFDGFQATYFGGPTADTATPVVVEPGTDARADFVVVVQPAFRVRGTLSNLKTGQVRFNLLSGDEDVGAGRVVLSLTSRTFEMLEVVSGNYRLRATQGAGAAAEIPLVVSGSDVDGLQMALEGPVEIPLTITILDQPDDSEGPPANVQLLHGPASRPRTGRHRRADHEE